MWETSLNWVRNFKINRGAILIKKEAFQICLKNYLFDSERGQIIDIFIRFFYSNMEATDFWNWFQSLVFIKKVFVYSLLVLPDKKDNIIGIVLNILNIIWNLNYLWMFIKSVLEYLIFTNCFNVRTYARITVIHSYQLFILFMLISNHPCMIMLMEENIQLKT